MARLRIGHSNLNSTLHIIGTHPTGFCEYCETLETIQHVLLNCRRYEEQRRIMTEELREGLAGAGIKYILQNCVNRQGKNNMCNFLIRAGLMKRI